VHRIPNGVDMTFFRPAVSGERERERRRLGFAPEACVVVSSGMIDPRKGMLALIRAAAATTVRPLAVAVAGPEGADAGYLTEIRAAIEAAPDGLDLRLMGEMEPAGVAALMRASDIFVLASRAEGLPNSLLEAMSTGLACIATDIPGSADVLRDGDGRLVPLDDPSALTQAIESLASDAGERARLGNGALEKIRTQYSFASVADRYRALYQHLVD
jgi:glycosyltransferase involved in cell wall biosynthesis